MVLEGQDFVLRSYTQTSKQGPRYRILTKRNHTQTPLRLNGFHLIYFHQQSRQQLWAGKRVWGAHAVLSRMDQSPLKALATPHSQLSRRISCCLCFSLGILGPDPHKGVEPLNGHRAVVATSSLRSTEIEGAAVSRDLGDRARHNERKC